MEYALFLILGCFINKERRICCFAGHSKVANIDFVYSKLLQILENLIIKENVTNFQVGNYGTFDKLAEKALNKLKEKYDIKIELVIPYLKKEINENKEEYYKNYDNIVMAEIPLSTPQKLKIIKCNEYMIKSCNYLICYIEHSWGGASKTLDFAKKKKNIKIINI